MAADEQDQGVTRRARETVNEIVTAHAGHDDVGDDEVDSNSAIGE